MVRKRTRRGSTRRGSRKYYDSDENDSDSDLDLNSQPSSPTPKRYGLRQRKQQTFFSEIDYDEEDELNSRRSRSDDDEFDVKTEITHLPDNHITTLITPLSPNSALSVEASNSLVEPEIEYQPHSGEGGLIDFEDVIRADVVLNTQTPAQREAASSVTRAEVKVKSVPERYSTAAPPFRERGRRGRGRPWARSRGSLQLNNTHNNSCRPRLSGGSSQPLRNSQQDEDSLEVQIDPMNFVQSHLGEAEPPKSNGLAVKKHFDSPKSLVSNGSTLPITIAPSIVESIEKYVPPELDEKEKEVILSNEYLLGNSFDMSADEFLETQAQKKDEVEEEVSVPQINFDEDSSGSDDVILIEKKPEIIVLDDD